jgi:hypothetical protein
MGKEEAYYVEAMGTHLSEGLDKAGVDGRWWSKERVESILGFHRT